MTRKKLLSRTQSSIVDDFVDEFAVNTGSRKTRTSAPRQHQHHQVANSSAFSSLSARGTAVNASTPRATSAGIAHSHLQSSSLHQHQPSPRNPSTSSSSNAVGSRANSRHSLHLPHLPSNMFHSRPRDASNGSHGAASYGTPQSMGGPRAPSYRDTLVHLTRRLQGDEDTVPLSDHELHVEMPHILPETFGLGSDDRPNIFSVYVPHSKVLFGAHGAWLERARVNHEEGFTINVSFNQLAGGMANKLRRSPPQAFPSVFQRLLAGQPQALTCRALDFYFLLFAMKSVMCKETERLTNPKNMYMQLLTSYFQFYMPVNDSMNFGTRATKSPYALDNSTGGMGSGRDPGSASGIGGMITNKSPTLNRIRSEALSAVDFVKKQGLNALSHHGQQQGRRASSQAAAAACADAAELEIFLTILFEVWIGAYSSWGYRVHLEYTQAAYATSLLRWVTKSIFYHRAKVNNPGALSDAEMAVLKARLAVMESLYAHYMPCFFRCLCINSATPEKIFSQMLSLASKMLNPWQYYYPSKATPTLREYQEHVQRYLAFYSIIPNYLIKNIKEIDISYSPQRWLKNKKGILDQIQTFIQVYGIVVQKSPIKTIRDLVIDEEKGFATQPAFHEQVGAAFDAVEHPFTPIFHRTQGESQAGESFEAPVEYEIVEAYKHFRTVLKAARQRIQQQREREITPYRLLTELPKVLGQFYTQQHYHDVDLHFYSKYEKFLQNVTKAFEGIFQPNPAIIDRSDRSEAHRTVSGRMTHDKEHVQQQVIRSYAGSRTQPVRSYEIAFLVTLTDALSTYLNKKFAPHPWMHDFESRRNMEAFLQKQRRLEGFFAVSPVRDNTLATGSRINFNILNDSDDEAGNDDDDVASPTGTAHSNNDNDLNEGEGEGEVGDGDGSFLGSSDMMSPGPSMPKSRASGSSGGRSRQGRMGSLFDEEEYYLGVVRAGRVEIDTLFRAADGRLTLDGSRKFADVFDLVAYYQECPYFIDAHGVPHRFNFYKEEHEEAHRTHVAEELSEPDARGKVLKVLQRARSAFAAEVIARATPFNLRFLADYRVWVWLSIPSLVLAASGSLITTLLLSLAVIVFFVIISLVSAAE